MTKNKGKRPYTHREGELSVPFDPKALLRAFCGAAVLSAAALAVLAILVGGGKKKR